MLELTKGVWTNKMLAEWFGIAEGTFKNTKKKRLAELELYAAFIPKKGKVEILRIKEPVYWKFFDADRMKVSRLYDKVADCFDTIENIATKMSEIGMWEVDFDTLQNYVLREHRVRFGFPSVPVPENEVEFLEGLTLLADALRTGELDYQEYREELHCLYEMARRKGVSLRY